MAIKLVEPHVKLDASANLDFIGNVFSIKLILKKSFRDDSGKCVSRDSCPNTYCKPNETYQECGNLCMEPTCAVADTSGRICDTSCNARCQCNEGFVRDQHGNCIEPEQCPNTYCPYNEVYTGAKKIFKKVFVSDIIIFKGVLIDVKNKNVIHDHVRIIIQIVKLDVFVKKELFVI